MRTVALAVLLVLLVLCACKSGYKKEDLVGVWKVEKMSSHPDGNFDVLAWLMVFEENGELRNIVMNMRNDIDEQDENTKMLSTLLSGKWELSGDSIKVRALSGSDDVIKIEKMEKDELVIRHKTFDETFTCRRFADDLDEAAERLASQKAILFHSR